MWSLILDAFLDTLKVLPFLLIIYILIEFLENRTSFSQKPQILQGNLAPLIGSATGLIPQCGFSVMAAKLYDKGLIRTGTLLAVLLATSDEAFIILLASGSSASAIMPLIVVKLAVGISVGYLVNFLYSAEKLHAGEVAEDIQAYSCGREHEGKSDIRVYLINPLLHTLQIAFYLLVVNLVFAFVIDAVGEDKIAASMIGGPYFQPFITAVIGLIPNCASSAVITATYINGGILFGSCAAGLCANAGLGLVVLFKNTKKIKRNIVFVFTLYLISVAVGIVVNSIAMLL